MLNALSDFESDFDQHSTHMLGLFLIWHESRHFASVFSNHSELSNAERKVEIGVFMQTDNCAHHGVHPHSVSFSLFLCFTFSTFGTATSSNSSPSGSSKSRRFRRHPPEQPSRQASASWISKINIFIFTRKWKHQICVFDECSMRGAPPPPASWPPHPDQWNGSDHQEVSSEWLMIASRFSSASSIIQPFWQYSAL